MTRKDWRPTATRATLERRALLLERARRFFRERKVLEVDTPLVINVPVTDVNIHSARVQFPDADQPCFLHTSPEYLMKRLLAAGSGDIFQICHVVRGMERGRLHNAEFTLIEWYRLGFSLEALMDEVETLVRGLLQEPQSGERLTYRDAFLREMALDPFDASLGQLRAAAAQSGFRSAADCGNRDELLDVLMATRVGPNLGRDRLCFVHRYPASQAALAQLDTADPRCALRFELYRRGIELANGFKELGSAEEQRTRFERDLEMRRDRGLPPSEIDERLLAALCAGLPDCAGVAVGFDRLAMLATGAHHIDEVLSFPIDRA